MKVTELLAIALGAILTNNFIFSQFLGICPFMGVSKKIDTAVGMGAAVTFVIISLPFCLPGKFSQALVIFYPIEFIYRIDNHKECMFVDINLHIEYPDFTDTGFNFWPHMLMFCDISTNQFRIII